ncbi:kinase domain protein (macronuclear) [Tetrahymena thermophila SB210]|uniref:non-specific serine/threonine protein kinase n=1 Tax=Tetrahymena thermophila (strain SB210) TaxID=312017 RepID=I7MEU1_TETTS|nr:kinase domain protein [Tetrahymena thermophila SB210]EAR97599.2 kinase domain protein [Tetrahymena thermophila SB210]|eukprot:XP_001017844.2 kinase domain protein [Tetrahymena thermophila SB210]
MEKSIIDFSELFKSNNWDSFKISRSLILNNLNSEEKNQNEQKNKEKLNEQLKYLKEQKDSQFQNIMNQLKDYLDQVRKNKDIEEEFICIQLQESLEFHKCIACHGYNYSVISLIDTGFIPKTYEKQIQLQSLLKQSIQQYFNKQDEKNINYHKALLANAYHNLQKEEYENAKDLLEELSKFYNLDELKKSECKEEESINFQLGFIESVHTYMALCYLYSNKLDDLEKQIECLKNLLNHINDKQRIGECQKSIAMKERIQNHVELFYIHFYFIKQDLVKSQNHLRNIDKNLEKSLLLFFLNQNSQLLSYIETIYYNLFGNELFQVFKELQQFELKNRGQGENINIQKIKQFFEDFKQQITNKVYSYGKGLILILSVIYTILLRLGEEYDEAIKHMNLIFQICIQTHTDFQQFLDLFFKYNRLICYLYKIVQKPSEKFEIDYNFCSQFRETGLNKLFKYQKGNEQFVIKKKKETNQQQKFQQLNEACIQMLLCHPNIQNIEEVFVDKSNEIVIVQKMQGENLNKLLIDKKIDQEKAMSYIQQILKAFCYLHSLNIIHSDFKLENVVIVLDDDTKIKIIDFGFSQIKIFNKFFTPLGSTKGYAPPEKKYTFESDIFSIGESIKKMFANNNFYKSIQMDQLINLMIENSIQNRCTIKQAYSKFQLEMLIYKIYIQINSQQEFNQDNEIYNEFANSMHFLFQKFRRFHYNTFSVEQETENEKTKFKEFQNKYQQFEIIGIIKSIKLLLDAKINTLNQSFVECLVDNDIKLFILKLLNFEKMICQEQNNSIDPQIELLELLEDCFRESNYEENKQIEDLINQLIVNNNKETNKFLEQIQEELDQIKYSKDELHHTEEYQKLIKNIENQLQNLEDKQKSKNNPNIDQGTQQQINNQSSLTQSDIQHSVSDNQDIKNINVGSYHVNESQQVPSYQINFITSSQQTINQDSQYTNIQNFQGFNQQSQKTFYTQCSQSQSQTQSEQQTLLSFLSNQQQNSQSEHQFVNLPNPSQQTNKI